MSLPSLNYLPNYFSNVTSWHIHLPFAYDLICKLRPKIFVELGVHYGDSYFTFCQSVNDNKIRCKCFGIDTWKGDEHSGYYGENVWNTVNKYNSDNYSVFSKLQRASFDDSLRLFKDNSIDILHIDGLHTYKAVSKDFYSWLPKVSTHGIILIHDIHEKKNGFEVFKFWNEIKDKFICVELSGGHGLGVLIKSKQLIKKDFLYQIFYNSFLQNYYKTRGEYFLIKNSCDDYQKECSQNSAIITELRHELEQVSIVSSEHEKNLNKLINEKIILADKIKRLTSSISWRITAFLRLFRRKLVDPFTRSLPKFDPKVYLELNPDLREVFKDDLVKAEEHYKIHGKLEGRLHCHKSINFTYNDWVKNFDSLNSEKRKKLFNNYRVLQNLPLISVILPVYNIDPNIFQKTVNSVKSQIYQNWELIIVDDCSNDRKLKYFLNELDVSDDRIRLIYRSSNGHISEALNTGINSCNGDYVTFLDHDDLFREHSLLRIAESINEHPEIKFIYTDEDKIDLLGNRIGPHFKPDWNPDLLLSQNFICHLCCVKTSLIHQVNGFRVGYEGCQDWDLFLRITEILNESEILHIPEILYHWRKGVGSTASSISSKEYVFANSIKTIESALHRRNIEGSVELVESPNNYIKINYHIPPKSSAPLVSILIPTRDQLTHLQKCIDGLLYNTSYENFEILILDNESKESKTKVYLEKLKKNNLIKVIRVSGKFNYSRINNLGAKHANGELLLFLNNDVKPINDGWLNEMVSHGVRKDVGCVGAKLIYPDNTIQHGGVILGIGGLAGHAFRKFPLNHAGYAYRLNLVQNYSAVTGACLLIKRSLFQKITGFNEHNLKVAFNDVDLCLRVKELGFRNVWTPYAILYHYESASRGDDLSGQKLKRYNKEAEYMRSNWATYIARDPAYNPNLSLDREDFSLALPNS